MTGSILARTARSLGWIIGWRMATRVLGLGSTLILVRLLLPSDFGLVALGAAFAQTIEALSNLGTDDALIREQHPDRTIYDTAFTMNAIRGVVTALVVAGVAGPVATFFDEPRLASLLLALAAVAVVDGFLNTGVVEFRRNFQFDKEFILNILPRIVSVVVAVSTAALFQSYWALIAGQAIFRILRVGASYRMHPFRPRFSLQAWRGLVLFSAWTWVLSILYIVQSRVDAFIIGRLLGTDGVGAYALGIEIATLPTSEIVDPIGRAAYSGFSATMREGGTHSLFYRLAASSLMVAAPTGLGLSMVADPLVRIALGARWVSVVPIIQLLSLTCGVAALGNLAFMLLRSHLYLASACAIALAGLVSKVAIMLVAVHWYGLPGAAAAAAIAVVVESAISLTIVVKAQRLSMATLVARCWRIIAACAVMVAILSLAGLAWTGGDEPISASIVRLSGSAALGATVYAGTLWTLWTLMGQPNGAEADMANTLAGLGRRLRPALVKF